MIYILELIDNKYYIGYTTNNNMTIELHNIENNTLYTKKYKPINIINNIIESNTNYTLYYMEKYGINNVRSYLFNNIILTIEEINIIIDIIYPKLYLNFSIYNKCVICNNNHNYIDCKPINSLIICPIKKSNKLCDCPTSLFKKHRKIKCFLNKDVIKDNITYYDNEYVNLDDIKLKLQIKQINTDQIKQITTVQIIQINTVQIKQINTDQIKQITTVQIKQINTDQNKQITTDQNKQINTEPIIQINTDQNKQINTDQNKQINTEPMIQINTEPIIQINTVPIIQIKKNQNIKCDRCNRYGHFTQECYAKTAILAKFNCRYCNKEFETSKGTLFHENIYCKNKKL
jgi:hypothetical protein